MCIHSCIESGISIYILNGAGKIAVITPFSKEAPKIIPTLQSAPSNLTFGGPDGKTVFVTQGGGGGFNDPAYNEAHFWHIPISRGDTTKIPLWADCAWVDGWPQETDPPPPDWRNVGQSGVPNMQRFCVPRHNFSINICYVDGHVQAVVLDDLWQQEWHRNWQGKAMKLSRP